MNEGAGRIKIETQKRNLITHLDIQRANRIVSIRAGGRLKRIVGDIRVRTPSLAGLRQLHLARLLLIQRVGALVAANDLFNDLGVRAVQCSLVAAVANGRVGTMLEQSRNQAKG